jgi:hypothetical protein
VPDQLAPSLVSYPVPTLNLGSSVLEDMLVSPRVHKLKIDPHHFEGVEREVKRFEIRENDRDFKIGDYLFLREYSPEYFEDGFTGREIYAVITCVVPLSFVGAENYVVLGIDINTSGPPCLDQMTF